MSVELTLAGVEVYFVSINVDNGIESQEEMLKHCTFPQLQDTEELQIWDRFSGYKDDFFILDSEGVVQRYIPYSAGESKLSEAEDYAGIKAAILEVVAIDEGTFVPPEDTASDASDDADDAPQVRAEDAPQERGAEDTGPEPDGDTSEGDPSEGSDAAQASEDAPPSSD